MSLKNLNRGDLLHLIEILAVVCALAGGWRAFGMTGADHERRLQKIEEAPSKETLVYMVREQSRQIQKLTDIVTKDHDAVMELAGSVAKRRN